MFKHVTKSTQVTLYIQTPKLIFTFWLLVILGKFSTSFAPAYKLWIEIRTIRGFPRHAALSFTYL